ncbi:ABC transporter substrate-binding protein [Fluviispira vulneris]|uniref:ABC transporter substrate-binding protein n=1 Tax=Fluviispira vulneris TaxID=2763012 RepID=UPI00164964AE|nr:ABC transporter substrate-binding protein [Fluviispira vulneris]
MKIKKKLYILISIVFLALIFFTVKTNFTANHKDILSINMAAAPSIPWDEEGAPVHVLETFTEAVHGNLIPFGDFNMENAVNQNTLLSGSFCTEKTCYANVKKGIYFHNGREVSAYDVEFSLIKDLFEKPEATFAYTLLEDLEGIEDKNGNVMSPLKRKELVQKNSILYPTGLLKSIEVIDNYNLKFHLKRKNKFFFQRISSAHLPIVPIEELTDDYKKWKKYPIGFGKYKVVNAIMANHEYFLKKVNPKENIPSNIKLFYADNDVGDIKMLLGGTQRGTQANDKIIIFPNIYSNGGFLFNYQTKLGQDPNFRKAISLALDREKIAAKGIHKELIPEDQMLPNFGWQKNYRADIPVQQQDLAQAKELLNKVPHELWQNKILTIPCYWEDAKDVNTLPYIQEIKTELKELGLKVEFQSNVEGYDKFKDGDENVLWFTGFAFASDDPNKNFAHFLKGSYFAHEYPTDPEYERLFQESSANSSKISESTKKLSEYFTRNNIMVILFNQRVSYAYDSKKIASLGEQYSGIKFEIWKVKMND